MGFKGVDREELLRAIDRTLDIWKAFNFQYIDQATVLRPLCQNIHQQTKATTAACTYCPIYFLGFHHVCRSVESMRIGDDSEIAKKEFINIKKMVIDGFNKTKKKLVTDKTWAEYQHHVRLKKAGAIKSSPVVKKKEEPVEKKRKVYKVRKDA
jgi:hypothetical protein